ncbi:MAG: hypothetical protein COA75_14805 [Cellvibrionales bacterium]|nr:MAG: hypothetical protein COA75_14805 [Cellvibrionales bacterium]
MTETIFLISIISGLAIISLSASSLLSSRFQFWPPPRRDSWQFSTFWWLFRVMLIALVALCVIDFNGLVVPRTTYYVFVGVPLAVVGFAIATYATLDLGWMNAHGEKCGLKTLGLFRWSRNPIYIFSIIGMVGLGISINSQYVYWVLSLWASMYVAAPFLEEPWLEEQYGHEFLAYKARVPRFLGFVKNQT